MKRNAKFLILLISVILFSCGFTGCLGLVLSMLTSSGNEGTSQPANNISTTRIQQQGETQVEKWQRLYLADMDKISESNNRDSDGRLTVEGIDTVLQPQAITRIGEITNAKLNEPGRPYWFKLRAIYKGYDANAERILLQDLGTQSDMGDAVWGAIFGIDSNAYPMEYAGGIESTFPTDANAIATFYIVAGRLTEHEGRQINHTEIFIRFVCNIEKPSFDTSKFIVASGMHYITVNDAHVTTQQDVMMNYFFGGAAGNPLGNVFDPIVYPLVDLMDARVEMNKKDPRNDYTFPTVRVKFVSEVIFRGQSKTTITVSTADNVLTETMSFTGRASSVTNGEKIRVYYTIAKDPLEKWEIQAIERF
jgi:hypothetical protein